MEFMQSFKIELNDFHRERLRMIDDFDYSRIAKKVSNDMDGLPASYLATGVENLKRYYAVALLDPKNRHAVSRPVDPFWHTHVLFTREYVDFNRSIFGHYIHHVPLDLDDKESVEHVTKLYDYTLQCYEKIFKQTDSDWWAPSDGSTFAPVCLHMEITNEDVLKNALFPQKESLKYM